MGFTPVLTEIRNLLDGAFGGEFTDDDWEHALGGTHVWITESDIVISHGSLVERIIACSGESLRVGYVEAVATAAQYRRRGHATSIMTRIGELIRERYPLGALSTGTHAFYEGLGWERWRGPTFVSGEGRRERTPDDDSGIMILRTVRSPELDPRGDIICDQRSGDVW